MFTPWERNKKNRQLGLWVLSLAFLWGCSSQTPQTSYLASTVPTTTPSTSTNATPVESNILPNQGSSSAPNSSNACIGVPIIANQFSSTSSGNSATALVGEIQACTGNSISDPNQFFNQAFGTMQNLYQCIATQMYGSNAPNPSTPDSAIQSAYSQASQNIVQCFQSATSQAQNSVPWVGSAWQSYQGIMAKLRF